MIEIPEGDPTLSLAFAHGGPPLQGVLRARPEDFIVVEDLGYRASGEGEHDFIVLRKRELNTQDVVRLLARHADVKRVAVGFAGLKDRNALTTQSFTVQLPGRESPDWSALDSEALEVISVQRHGRKIRRGSLRGNAFQIRLTAVSGDREQAEQRLQTITRFGVPNYFGAQRFGYNGSNLQRLNDLFDGRGRRPKREQRAMWLSAARSYLFNRVLDQRVRAADWDRWLQGDVMLLQGSLKQFLPEPGEATINERLLQLDIHPSGPLCGVASRSLQTIADAATRERTVLEGFAEWIAGLQRMGLNADRRSLRLPVQALQWHWAGDDVLELAFELPSGAYATAVLRELMSERQALRE